MLKDIYAFTFYRYAVYICDLSVSMNKIMILLRYIFDSTDNNP